LPSNPKHLFTDTVAGCPLIDLSVYAAGVAHHHAVNHGCGFNGKSFNCDFWNLTRACDGSAAGVPGSEAMIAVCDKLCDLVDGCDGSMLDLSHDENSGLCTLHAGTPVLTEACFFYSSAGGIIDDEASCAVPSAGLPGRDPTTKPKYSRKFTVETSEPNRNANAGAWTAKKGKKGRQAGNLGLVMSDGACVRAPEPVRDTGVQPVGKNKNGRKKTKTKFKKTKSKGKGLDDGNRKHNQGKSGGNNGDAGAETMFGTTGSRYIVVGVAVAAVLLALGFVVALTHRAKRITAKQQEIAFNEKADSEWIGSSSRRASDAVSANSTV